MSGLNKVVKTYDEALKGLKDNMSVMAGGFGLCGIPEGSIQKIYDLGIKGLTFISCTAGIADFGLGILLEKNQIKKVITSYCGENPVLEQRFLNNEIEIQFVPQGTLAEKIRAHGAGIPAFYTPTGFGTPVEDGKDVKKFDGKGYILENALGADFALIKAWKGDTMGNLIYRKTAANFNPMMAMAGKITVAEVEEIVEPGELDPNFIHTPGIYVNRIIQGTFEKRIERRTLKS